MPISGLSEKLKFLITSKTYNLYAKTFYWWYRASLRSPAPWNRRNPSFARAVGFDKHPPHIPVPARSSRLHPISLLPRRKHPDSPVDRGTGIKETPLRMRGRRGSRCIIDYSEVLFFFHGIRSITTQAIPNQIHQVPNCFWSFCIIINPANTEK